MNEETTNQAGDNRPNTYNRRQFMRVATLTAGGALLTACNQSPQQPVKITAVPSVPPAVVTATAAASIGKTYFPSPAPDVPDAYTFPLPAFQSVNGVPGQGGTVNVFSLTSGTLQSPKDMNRFWQELEQRLNVTWNVTLAAGNDIYAQKVGVLLASGDLPDLFLIAPSIAPSLLQAIQQDAFTDLTPYLSGSALNAYPNLARISSQLWQNVMVGGKIYGVPRSRGFTGSTLLYRRDWAQKVGIPNPKNANDFYKLMQAFSKGNPDGGQANTWGMGFNTLGFSGHQFFMNLFRVPNQWRVEANGDLTYYIQAEEYRQAVAFMTKMYAGGLFYPNSLTQSGLQCQQNFTAGKYGSYLDGFNALYTQRRKTEELNPNADVGILVPFGADGSKGNHWLSAGYLGYAGIPSSVSSSERVKELLRILDYLSAPIFSVESNFLTLGIDGWDNKIGPNGLRVRTTTGDNEIGDVATIGNGPFVFYYPAEPQLAPVMQEYARRLLAIGVTNPVGRLVSPTASKQRGTLNALIDDRVLRIVRGLDPLSALNNLIAEWKSQGGTQITQEYAKALHR